MQLHFTRFPFDFVEGAYTVKGHANRMPDHARMLEAGRCADSFAHDLAPHVVVSDMRRTAESSLDAMQRKKGVQPPSFSHHNYGRAIDLEVTESIARCKATGAMAPVVDGAAGFTGDHEIVHDKASLDRWMAERGWYCFRGDHKTGRAPRQPYDESWHYDYLGDLHPGDRPTYPYVNERVIAWAACQSRYAHNWIDVSNDLRLGHGLAYQTAAMACQRMLTAKGFYHGAIDGKIGPLSLAAAGALQRAWMLPNTGKLDPRTVQVLTFVTADVIVTEMVEHPLAMINGQVHVIN